MVCQRSTCSTTRDTRSSIRIIPSVPASRPKKSPPDLPAAFALAFFEKGVANFLCTAWSIGDQAARDFAEELYRNLLGDDVPAVQMYEAIRYARHKVFRSVRADGVPDTRTWAAYQHYGNPYFRLFRPRVTA